MIGNQQFDNQVTPTIPSTPNPTIPVPQSPQVIPPSNSIKLSKLYTSPSLLALILFITEIIITYLIPIKGANGISIPLAGMVSYLYAKKTGLLFNKKFNLQTSLFYFIMASVVGVVVTLVYLPSELQSIDQTGQSVIGIVGIFVSIFGYLVTSFFIFLGLSFGGKLFLRSLSKTQHPVNKT